MLQQLGAEVIKIEPPGKGDDFRHYTEHAGLPGMSIPFASANAGKRSVALDLKSGEGRAAALQTGGTRRHCGRELPPRRDRPARARL